MNKGGSSEETPGDREGVELSPAGCWAAGKLPSFPFSSDFFLCKKKPERSLGQGMAQSRVLTQHV